MHAVVDGLVSLVDVARTGMQQERPIAPLGCQGVVYQAQAVSARIADQARHKINAEAGMAEPLRFAEVGADLALGNVRRSWGPIHYCRQLHRDNQAIYAHASIKPLVCANRNAL